MDMFLYLFTIAPIISVPPVLPFAEKTSPSPAPQRRAPIMIAINGWSCRIGFPFSSHSKMKGKRKGRILEYGFYQELKT